MEYQERYLGTEGWMSSIWTTRERNRTEQGSKLQERSRSHGNSGLIKPVSTVVHTPSYSTGWEVGALFRCSGLPARSPQCFSSNIAWRLLHWTEAASRVSPHPPHALPESCSGPACQWPRCHKGLPGSKGLPKTIQHVKRTQRSLLHKTTFSTTNKRETA